MTQIAKSCEDGSQAEKESREKDHCRKVSYVTEETSITPRCPGNCACCKQGASSKSSNEHSAQQGSFIFLLFSTNAGGRGPYYQCSR